MLAKPNCLINSIERVLVRSAYRQSRSTQWIGFDASGQTVFGFRLATHSQWEIVCWKIMTKIQRTVKLLNSFEMAHTNAGIDRWRDYIGLINYERDEPVMHFYIFSLKTEEIVDKRYIIKPNRPRIIDYIEIYPLSNGVWIFKCFTERLENSNNYEAFYFYSSIITDNSDQLKPFASIENNFVKEFFGFYRDFVWQDEFLFSIVFQSQNSRLEFEVFDLKTNAWIRRGAENSASLCLPCGYDQCCCSFLAISSDSKRFSKIRVDRNNLTSGYFRVDENASNSDSGEIPFGYLGHGLPFYAFATERLIFVGHCLNDAFEKDRLEIVVLNHRMLPLKDLASIRIGKMLADGDRSISLESLSILPIDLRSAYF